MSNPTDSAVTVLHRLEFDIAGELFAIIPRETIITELFSAEGGKQMRKTLFDDGFQNHLVEGASFVGEPGIPMLMDLPDAPIPETLVPFNKAAKQNSKHSAIDFYIHDKEFARVLTNTPHYLDLFKRFESVLTPDCTLMVGQSRCLQETNTYMNRAVGFFLQKNGIRIIPNIRWSDESSFEYCFLGVPKGKMVAVSTHGCIKTQRQKELFRTGFSAMLDALEPPIVLVHGYTPESIFGPFKDDVAIYRYPSQFELTHPKGGEA